MVAEWSKQHTVYSLILTHPRQTQVPIPLKTISSFQVTQQLALFKLPPLFGGTYGMRLFYRERKRGAKLMNVHGFYRTLSIYLVATYHSSFGY